MHAPAHISAEYDGAHDQRPHRRERKPGKARTQTPSQTQRALRRGCCARSGAPGFRQGVLVKTRPKVAARPMKFGNGERMRRACPLHDLTLRLVTARRSPINNTLTPRRIAYQRSRRPPAVGATDKRPVRISEPVDFGTVSYKPRPTPALPQPASAIETTWVEPHRHGLDTQA